MPPGFTIELIASEPDIGQPMNLNFDAAGRLWVTHSVEYPYPVAGEGVEERDERFGPNGDPPARDRLSVISHIGTEALTITHVAEGLNIPIGIVPLSPTSAIGYSIPNVLRWDVDTNTQPSQPAQPATLPPQLLYGPFGNVDTHGMVNGLTHWIDGWVYACHGFRNTSTVRGTDGHVITMNSGNTFRFRPDGSRIEQVTWGQVNPFGLTFDEWGNIYTADCHSKPLTCLVPGAYYSSFGKPHDGLGFGPNMIEHNHGSTGICGPCYYAADAFPEDDRDCLYLCNPVTGQVHRDKLIWNGSSPQVDASSGTGRLEFITCDDEWFRPVDLQLGPDGALYIADFYNAIIGHYEVPLPHPRRDRHHGRIWRVTYTGDGRRQTSPPDLTQESLEQLIERLDDANLTTQMLASHHIADRFGDRAISRLRDCLDAESSERQRLHGMWLLHRLGALSAEHRSSLTIDDSPIVKTHCARLLASLDEWTSADRMLTTELLRDEHASVRRAAAEACRRHPREEVVDTLISMMPSTGDPDTHLRHAIRLALRSCLAEPGVLDRQTPQIAASREVASVCLGIPSADAAAFLLTIIKEYPNDQQRPLWVTHIARHGTEAHLEALCTIARNPEGVKGDLPEQVKVLMAVGDGLASRNIKLPPCVIAWGGEVASRLLKEVEASPLPWSRESIVPGTRAVVFGREQRPAVDGRLTPLWSSLPGGEAGVGVYRSAPFELPPHFTFWLAGHDGHPPDAAAGKNLVRLIRDSDGEELRAARVPRQDAPLKVEWEFLKEPAGQLVRLELVDGLDLSAFAWVAAGRFSVARLNPPEYMPAALASRLVSALKLDEVRPEIERLLADVTTPASAIASLASAHLALAPDVQLSALLPLLGEGRVAVSLQSRLRKQVVTRDAAAVDELMQAAMRSASSERQLAMAESLSSHREGAQRLVDLVAAGLASPQLLNSPAIALRLDAAADKKLRDRIGDLTRNLQPLDEQTSQLIASRRKSYDGRTASIERGHRQFSKQCAVCHQIGKEGKKVGPQLDGVGIRGLDRLLEDILDPNRNVDAAFRSMTLLMNDGRVLTGLLRSEDGASLVLADAKGEEFRVAVSDVDERTLSPLSLMPQDIAAKMPADELHDLLAYLLSQTAQGEGGATAP